MDGEAWLSDDTFKAEMSYEKEDQVSQWML
jgi:hypothetical protein